MSLDAQGIGTRVSVLATLKLHALFLLHTSTADERVIVKSQIACATL